MTVNRSTLPSGEVSLRDVRRLIRRAEAEAVQLQRRERGRRAPGSATAAPFTVRRRTLGGGLNRAYAEMVRRDAPLAQGASRRKRRPRKPVPRPVGWHMRDVGLAQADQVNSDGALRAVPGAWCRSNERATGSGPACPYLRKLSSKALLYRCAVSRAGCYGRGDCRRRPTTPWSSKCAGQVYVVGAGGVEPPSSSVSAKCKEPLCGRSFLQVVPDRRGRS